jgi:hypothetical protein
MTDDDRRVAAERHRIEQEIARHRNVVTAVPPAPPLARAAPQPGISKDVAQSGSAASGIQPATPQLRVPTEADLRRAAARRRVDEEFARSRKEVKPNPNRK